MGKGVCGTAAAEMNTIVVGNVEKFPGHIACDADSKSEIVVPIEIEGRNWGVLDLDSYEYSSFDQTDKKYLEQICKILGNKLNLGKFTVS
jgi:putative methionine-R-sulfoxide reductase with GAF domain